MSVMTFCMTMIQNRTQVCNNQGQEDSVKILQDKSATGRERPWKKHKESSLQLSDSYKRIGEKGKSYRVQNCGSILTFNECPGGHEKHLIKANFCRVRLCPMCAWRKSLVIFTQLLQICHVACSRQDLRFIMMTLTVKNVPGQKLSDQLDDMFKSWDRLTKRIEFKSNVQGWFRALEVTHNVNAKSTAYDTYHPHFHILLAVKPGYFKGQKYIKQSRWMELWRSAARLDYNPIVDVRTVKASDNPEGKPIEKAVAEVGKYTTKPGDYLFADEQMTDKAVLVLDEALHGRRLVSYGGILADIKKELKMADVENADLIQIDDITKGCTCSACGSQLTERVYKWHIGYREYVG